jgi:hypothetical protein
VLLLRRQPPLKVELPMQRLIPFSHIPRAGFDRVDVTTLAIRLVVASIPSQDHGSRFHSLCQHDFSLLLVEELDADWVSILYRLGLSIGPSSIHPRYGMATTHETRSFCTFESQHEEINSVSVRLRFLWNRASLSTNILS